MKIGLFGYYKHGNFGDDLMGVLIGQHLLGKGHDVRLYGLDDGVADAAGLDTVHSVRDLVSWSDCLVYGGGGIFLEVKANQALERDLGELIDAKLHKGVPLYAISVGGDLNSRYAHLGDHQKRLLREADFVSFRNPEDCKLADEAGVKAFEVFPDLVWTVGANPSGLQRRDLISLELSGTRNKPFCYAAFALAGLISRTRAVDVDLSIGNGQGKENSLKNALKGKAFERRQYTNVQEMTTLAQYSRWIFTSRLHFGLVGLACGSTTFLVNPAGKARLVFEHLGLDGHIIERPRDLLRVIYDIMFGDERKQLLSGEQRARVASCVSQARGHLRLLGDLLDQLATRK